MTVWVQNYRFVDNTEVFFNYGDNQIIVKTGGPKSIDSKGNVIR